MPVDAASAEAFLRGAFEPLQYVAFFGVFLLFAALETVGPRDPAPAERGRRIVRRKR